MKPDSNQPTLLYGTAKTHKFETLADITVSNLEFRPTLIKLKRLHTMRRKLYRVI